MTRLLLHTRRYPLIAFGWQVVQNFQADRCLHSAAALTYLSLFAVVPLLTVGLALLSAVPAFADADTQIQQFIFTHFLPSSGQEIQSYLVDFSQQARQLTAIGLVFLGVTALTMLMKIEQEFNLIWHTRGQRSGLSSFLRSWAILSLGPLCVGLAIGMSTYLASLQVFASVDIFGARRLLLVITPYALTAAAFTLLFAVIPNTRVALRDAAIGGLTSAFFFEVAKYVFATFMAKASYAFVYGTFAAIPLFLLWVHTSWIIVLAGAETAHAVANYGSRSSNLSPLIAALGVLETLWRRYARGETRKENEVLMRNFLFEQRRLSAEQWAHLRDTLLSAGLIRGDKGEYVLARNLQNYTLAELCERFDSTGHTADPPVVQPQWLRDMQLHLAGLRDYQNAQLQIPLTDIFDNTAGLESDAMPAHTDAPNLHRVPSPRNFNDDVPEQ